MKLTVIWQNPMRLPDERQKIELAYRDRLIELCGGVTEAFNYHEEHYRQHQNPCSQWARLNAAAHLEATRSLLPDERKLAIMRVRFEN